MISVKSLDGHLRHIRLDIGPRTNTATQLECINMVIDFFSGNLGVQNLMATRSHGKGIRISGFCWASFSFGTMGQREWHSASMRDQTD